MKAKRLRRRFETRMMLAVSQEDLKRVQNLAQATELPVAEIIRRMFRIAMNEIERSGMTILPVKKKAASAAGESE